MKRFVYLTQSKSAQLPESYADLESEDSDLIQVTWGTEVPGCIFLPKSTWTQGRNRLLAEARSADRPDYLYYIFLDDDLILRRGGWREFEALLLEYEPAVGTPYCLQCFWMLELPDLDVQRCVDFDAMCNAYHREVVQAGIALPYYEALDKESWFYSQWFATEFSLLLYPGHVLQFNKVHVDNTYHGDYQRGGDNILESVRKWFYGEVVRCWTYDWRRWLPHAKIQDFRRRLRKKLWRGLRLFQRPHRRIGSYALSERKKASLFHLKADFWRQRGLPPRQTPL